jgi:hypothetical protein
MFSMCVQEKCSQDFVLAAGEGITLISACNVHFADSS